MKRLCQTVGSLKLTFPAMLVLIAAILASYRLEAAPWWWLLAPLALLAANLAAAIAVHPRFRRQLPLLAFHLCLLAALVLSLAGVLTRVDARVELLTGQDFDPGAVEYRARGPWFSDAVLGRLRFRPEGFEVDYEPGLRRGETRAVLAVAGEDGGWSRYEIGDTRALVQSGTRFYTTSNKGLAALLTWVGAAGAAQSWAVHFPSWPLNDWKQVNDWITPSGERLVLELAPSLAVPAAERWTFASARVPPDAVLRVRRGEGEAALVPGRWLAAGEGRLRFDGIGTWMGYQIAYDPTLPWLLATGIVGALALGWHFLGAFGSPRRSEVPVADVPPAGA